MSTPEDLVSTVTNQIPDSPLSGPSPTGTNSPPSDNTNTPQPKSDSLLSKAVSGLSDLPGNIADNITGQLGANLKQAGGEKQEEKDKDKKPEDLMKLVDNLLGTVYNINNAIDHFLNVNLQQGVRTVMDSVSDKGSAPQDSGDKKGDITDTISNSVSGLSDTVMSGAQQVVSVFKGVLSPAPDTVTDPKDEVGLSNVSVDSIPSPTSESTTPDLEEVSSIALKSI